MVPDRAARLSARVTGDVPRETFIGRDEHYDGLTFSRD